VTCLYAALHVLRNHPFSALCLLGRVETGRASS